MPSDVAARAPTAARGGADDAPPSRDAVAETMVRVQDVLTDFFESFETTRRFREDAWERPGGGGGASRVLSGGDVFEKVGVGRSVVHGVVPPQLREHLGTSAGATDPHRFWATGVSVVAHPRSPMVPIVHLNVRFFELSEAEGAPVDRWYGGGTDLTPTYPHWADPAFFHRGLKAVCDRYPGDLYGPFKAVCDGYFVNTHRGDEARGVGGIFFDHERARPGLGWDTLHRFVTDVGTCLREVYGPIVTRRKDEAYGERERHFQLLRRGRYVEFNLVHDRGTRFGLQTDGRTESVLMSLPPLAAWDYDPSFVDGSFEADFADMIRPRDWISWESPRA